MKMKKSSLESKKVTTAFALVALVAGFLFLNKGITGNAILTNPYSFSMLPVIGLLLILCSAILALHIIKKM